MSKKQKDKQSQQNTLLIPLKIQKVQNIPLFNQTTAHFRNEKTNVKQQHCRSNSGNLSQQMSQQHIHKKIFEDNQPPKIYFPLQSPQTKQQGSTDLNSTTFVSKITENYKNIMNIQNINEVSKRWINDDSQDKDLILKYQTQLQQQIHPQQQSKFNPISHQINQQNNQNIQGIDRNSRFNPISHKINHQNNYDILGKDENSRFNPISHQINQQNKYDVMNLYGNSENKEINQNYPQFQQRIGKNQSHNIIQSRIIDNNYEQKLETTNKIYYDQDYSITKEKQVYSDMKQQFDHQLSIIIENQQQFEKSITQKLNGFSNLYASNFIEQQNLISQELSKVCAQDQSTEKQRIFQKESQTENNFGIRVQILNKNILEQQLLKSQLHQKELNPQLSLFKIQEIQKQIKIIDEVINKEKQFLFEQERNYKNAEQKKMILSSNLIFQDSIKASQIVDNKNISINFDVKLQILVNKYCQQLHNFEEKKNKFNYLDTLHYSFCDSCQNFINQDNFKLHINQCKSQIQRNNKVNDVQKEICRQYQNLFKSEYILKQIIKTIDQNTALEKTMKYYLLCVQGIIGQITNIEINNLNEIQQDLSFIIQYISLNNQDKIEVIEILSKISWFVAKLQNMKQN